jgi:ABC-2 type transport system permease protein
MRGILVIAGKDLRNLFLSPLFYGIAGLCSIAWTLVYFLGLEDFNQASMMNSMQGGGEGASLHFVVFARHVSLVNLMMIFAVSAMSIRLFTEERRAQTMALLLTSPVTATQITLGKFLAGLLGAWALLGVSFLYPLSLRVFAEFDWGPLIASYIGLLLITGCYVAVGMFASCLTENAVMSVVMSLIFNVMLWFIGALSDASQEPTLTKIFEHLNVGAHFIGFIKGGISAASVTFFVSVIVLMAFLTQRVVESNRWR